MYYVCLHVLSNQSLHIVLYNEMQDKAGPAIICNNFDQSARKTPNHHHPHRRLSCSVVMFTVYSVLGDD